MKKMIFINLIFILFISSNLFSQSSRVFKNDTTGVTIRQFENGRKIKYASTELMFRIDTLLRNDSTYLSNLGDFLNSTNSKIAFFNYDNPPFNTMNGTGIIVLADTMDAYNYLDVFKNSGLFVDIDLNWVGDLN